MKRKDYEKLLNKIEEANLVYGGWVLEIGDYNPADGNYSYEQLEQERDKAKEILDGYKAELEDILTVDMEVFADKFVKYINFKSGMEYEIDTPTVDDTKLWIARPKNKKPTTFNKLIEEESDMFILGAGDKKVLPRQAVFINGMKFPTMYSVGKYFSAYNLMLGKYDVKYRQFEKTFMLDLENELVENYKPKNDNNRKGSK